MKSVRDLQSKLIFVVVCFLVVFPCSVWAEDSGNHYGWDKYPGTDTAATGGVDIGGTLYDFNIPIKTTDWVRTQVSTTEAYYTWSITNYAVGSALIDLTYIVDFDPYVTLNFNVSAGTAPTTFTLNSSVVSFPAISNPLAYATAGLTLTDAEDGGATITGLFSGGKNYEAKYNGSTIFADLVSTFSADPCTTNTSSERKPASGYQTISGSVSNIESHFEFTLTANDLASGTSYFKLIVPEPATIALLGLGGLALLRRKS